MTLKLGAARTSRWSTRPDVSIRIYPADNHFFFPGSGPSAPAESEPAQHVDPQVVLDMAEWVNTGQLSP